MEQYWPIIQNGVPGILVHNPKRYGGPGVKFYPHIAGGQTNGGQPAMSAALPFASSAHEHVEPAFSLSQALSTATFPFNPVDIPAYGYLRHVLLECTVTGPSAGTAVADGPWSGLSSIVLQDVNGANIFGPMDGYASYVSNLLGGYANRQNPLDSPLYDVSTAYLPKFYLRVPVEVSRSDGFGALANQNAAANYKLSLTANILAGLLTAVTGTATLNVRGWLEAWTLPAPTSDRGIPQAQAPPLLGSGQYWSARTQVVSAGSNTVGLTRVGNYIRALGFIGRDNSGVRTNASLPDPFQFNWDGMAIVNTSQGYMRNYLFEKTNGALTVPTGVLALLYNYGGAAGDIGNDPSTLWLPTMQSSRLEITGTWAGAGTMQILTNEIAPVDADQATRYQFQSGSGAYGVNPVATPAQA
jgi:hypothetical protein